MCEMFCLAIAPLMHAPIVLRHSVRTVIKRVWILSGSLQGRVTEEDVNDILHRFKQLDEDNDGEFGHEVMS